jgi:SH3-like domain-containing protein
MESGMFKRVAVWLVFLLALGAGSAQAFTMVSVNANNVNMRSGPDDKYAVLWELGTGYPLKVLEEHGNWVKVEDFEGDVGWIYKTLVDREPHLIVKKRRVNMRSGPGDNYRVVGKANYGVVFKTLEVKGGWARVKHENGLVGWISRSLLWGW